MARHAITPLGTWIIPNPRHVEMISRVCDMENCKPAPTPIVSVPVPGEEAKPVSQAEHTMFRKAVGIARYLGSYMPAVNFGVKVL